MILSDSELQARMETALAGLERAHELLVRPTQRNLDDCRAALNSAVASLTIPAPAWAEHAADAGLAAKALHLRQSVANASYLLRTAARRQRKWLQILRSKIGGYTACGDPAELTAASRFCLRG